MAVAPYSKVYPLRPHRLYYKWHRPVGSTAGYQRQKPCDCAATTLYYWDCQQHSVDVDGSLLMPSTAAGAVAHDEHAAGTQTVHCT